MSSARLLAAALLTGALPLAAPAQQIYTDQAAFLAASGPVAMESFECHVTTDPTVPAPILTPAFTMSIQPALSSTVAPMFVDHLFDPHGPFATHGVRYVQAGGWPNASNGQFDLTFSFVAPIEEFGFTITDFGEFPAWPGMLIATVLGNPYVVASNPPVKPNADKFFWGIRSPGNPFTTLVLRKTSGGDGIGMDEILHSDLSLPDYCAATWTDLGFAKAGAFGLPRLSGLGNLQGDSNNVLELNDARPFAPATFVMSFMAIYAPFKFGVLVPHPTFLVTVPTSAAGTVTLPFVFPDGVPPGFELYFQYWIQDPDAVVGFAASNGLRGVTP